MRLDGQKELTPVVYGDSAVKLHDTVSRAPGELCFPMHWHERMELLLLQRGGLSLTLGSVAAYAPAGSVAVILPGQPHRGEAGSAGVAYQTIMFDLPTFYNATNAVHKYLMPIAEQKVVFAPVSDAPEVYAAAKTVADGQLADSGDASSLLVVGGIYRLLGELYRHCLLSEAVKTPSDERFRHVTRYMEAHFSEELSSRALSRHFGYEEAYFCRRFKAVTGLSPMTYLQILRLEQAKKLLHTEPDLKITEVAARCGFSDPGYFARCFKKHYGIVPTDYLPKP